MAKIKKPVGHNYNPLKYKPKKVQANAFHQVYWPYLPLLLVLVLAVGLAFSPGAFKKLTNQGQVLGYATEMSRQSLLNETNDLRSGDNLADFRLSSKLDAAAQAKANDMVKRNYWSHDTPDGKSPWAFVVASHYSYQKLGENLAAGFGDSDSVIKAWLASPTHRQNLLDPKYTDVGFGFANSPNFTAADNGPATVVVAMYGQPSGALGPISSNPPATTESSTNDAKLASRTSRAAVIFAKSPLASVATSLAAITLVAAVLFWATRHFIALRRAWVKSERFVIRHPAMDLFLLAVVVLSYVLSQTAGLIQ